MVNESVQKEIIQLSNAREIIVDAWEKSWNETEHMFDESFDEQLDEYSVKIEELIMQFNAELPLEFILEELTKLGHAPSILYDDNGHFAITEDAIQTICSGDEPMDCALQFMIHKDQWKPTIREALEYYLNNEG